ncbi:helix-turn-helix domain-containing protein [Niallia taxi]|uniref:helix-turn-helix domain-containing protein n=1 Tax=Niallia taxi TaxID=2499688 RepID=UPI0021A2DAC3|nr:helix-turn-helix transcriptional regulator [Niallia taxi]MCT2347146.1 helix-turn-helix domain-containing protein [Niallia taxi]
MSTLKNRLKELRKKNKLTQADVAKFLDISESAYGYYEQGRNEPSLSSITKLSKKYGVTTSFLLGEVDEIKTPNEEKNTLSEINKLVKEFGIEDFGFFDIEQWKKLSPEDIDELRRHFEWVSQKAKERNEDNK